MRINSGKSYQSRAWFLKKLGFRSYGDYLASDLWKQVRERVFEIKGRECFLCGKPATQAHHSRYHEADLVGRKLKYIHPVCGKCHEEIEFRRGKKATLIQAKKAFNRKRRAHMPAVREREQIRKLTALFCYREKISLTLHSWECEAE